MTLKKASKYISILFIILTGCLLIFLYQSGCLTDSSKMEAVINSFGIFAPLVFILIQIIQVVIPIIPGGVSSSIGVVLFGPSKGFVYNYIGLMIGVLIAFLIVRKYGKKFILKFTDEAIYDKCIKWLNKGKRFELFFFIAILIPGLPDDVICMISALANVSFKKYIIINAICRPVSLIAYSLSVNTVMNYLGQVL